MKIDEFKDSLAEMLAVHFAGEDEADGINWADAMYLSDYLYPIIEKVVDRYVRGESDER